MKETALEHSASGHATLRINALHHLLLCGYVMVGLVAMTFALATAVVFVTREEWAPEAKVRDIDGRDEELCWI